jgi:hypothetical protein
MVNNGLHFFNPDWQPNDGFPRGRMYSASFKDVTFKCYGSNEELTFPVQVCTRCKDVKEAIANFMMVDYESIELLSTQGCYVRRLYENDEVPKKCTIKGIQSFKQTPHKWKHPICIIGTGYQGMKTAMVYLTSGNKNIQLFDRHDRVGGYCWINAANKTSRIQTELGSFHVWGGHELMKQNGGVLNWINPDDWGGIWPYKKDILRHFQYCAEQYGILPYCKFNCNVAKLDIVGGKEDHGRYYNLHVAPASGEGTTEEVPVSLMYNFPGSMTRNRIVEYPGEDVFDGICGYGMSDEAPYDTLKGSCSAILGNGAFAVENIRTCCDYGAIKVYLVTRRKNLASPRVPCWFVHGTPVPVPGAMTLRMFEPMYKLADFGDPFDFWSVHTTKDRGRATIMQQSRFGIGDVTFLAIIWGRCEYVQDTLKRLTKNTMHLTGGQKLENVNNIIKSLGLLGDYAVDRLHRMTKMIGAWCDGDYRRPLSMDAPGMNAANFTTFSVLGSIGFVRDQKVFHDFPKEYFRCAGMGMLQQLPTNKVNDKEDKPAYVYDVKYAMSAGVVTSSMCPKMQAAGMLDGDYKYRLYHEAHSTDYLLKEAKGSWDAYQKDWIEQGFKHDYVPYPYTREMIEGFFEEYNAIVGTQCNADGPPKGPDIEFPKLETAAFGQVPQWADDDNVINSIAWQVETEHKAFWSEKTCAQDMFRRPH